MNQKTLSVFVNRAIPDFVRHEHPRFYTFIETFFEYLENKYNTDEEFEPHPYWIASNIVKNNDIDETYSDYLQYIHNELAIDFPTNVDGGAYTPYEESQHRHFLKMISHYYQSKGTVAGFTFFFRMLFNTYFDYYLPKLDILRVSDGKWTEPYHISIYNNNDTELADEVATYTNLIDARVVGATSGATGYVDLIYDTYVYAPKSTVVNDTYSETFDENDEIFDTTVIHVSTTDVTYSIHDISAEVLSAIIVKINGVQAIYLTDYTLDVGLSEITLLSVPNLGDVITVSSATQTGKRWLNIVSRDGEFLEGETLNFYPLTENNTPSVTFISDYKIREQSYDITDSTYFVDASQVGISRPVGYWLNMDGWLSSDKKLQNSYYYQDYSYVIQTDVIIHNYLAELKANTHIAGFKMFSSVILHDGTETSSPDAISLADNHTTVIDYQLTPFTYDNDVALNQYTIFESHLNYVGLDWSELDRFKTTYYNQFLTDMRDKDELSNDSGTWGIFYHEDFKINDRNNHALLFFDRLLKTDEYIIGENNHQFWGQFLSYDSAVDPDIEVYSTVLETTRSYYNEYYTASVAGTDITLSQSVNGGTSTADTSFLVFVNGLLAGTSSFVSDVLTLDDSMSIGDYAVVMPFVESEVIQEQLNGSNSRDLTYTNYRRLTPIIFKNKRIIPDYLYVLDGSTITFNDSVSNLDVVDIIHINKQ